MNDLSKRTEAQLFSELRETGDSRIREKLVRRYLPLARHVARRFRGGDAADDLFQVASYALVKAVDKFDPGRGLAFSSYAVPTISGELKRHARDTGWGIHVPRGLQERSLAVERTVASLTASEGRSPTTARIAKELGLTTEEVLEAIDAGANHTLESLDTPLSSSEADSASRIEQVGGEDRRYGLVEDVHALAPVLRTLPDRERTMLMLRFGEEMPQAEIARHLGVSQMQVSRMLRRTLDGLAERVDEHALAS
jgi:RNA polymerase sigma-B factor